MAKINGARSLLTHLALESVTQEVMFPTEKFLLQITPSDDAIVLEQWCSVHRELIEQAILNYGGVVFRNFGCSPATYKLIVDTLYPSTSLSYAGGVVTRPEVGEGVYLTNSVDKRLVITQHHEMSYFRKWPMRISFFCEVPATSGGETSVLSTRTFMRKLDKKIISEIEKKEVMYLRNYPMQGLSSSWQQSFRTSDRLVVEEFCRKQNMNYEWLSDGRLRTRHRAQGTAKHPQTGEQLWHNFANVLNKFCGQRGKPSPVVELTKAYYSPEALENMLNLSHEDMPTNSYYGDGSFFEYEVMEQITSVAESSKVSFKWKPGDFMILDNMLSFHGRNAYEGDQRRIHVMMKVDSSNSGVSPVQGSKIKG